MRILIGGGGTGGHIYPGLALARHIINKDKDAEVLFVGTDKGLETKIVPAAGFALKTIPVRALTGKSPVQLCSVAGRLIKSISEAKSIIREFQPDITVGTGGYASVPVTFGAKISRIPVVLHEQNAIAGKANRTMGKVASRICVSFAFSGKFFNQKKVVITGNPRASEVVNANREESLIKLGIVDPYLRTVLVFSGSQGARRFNEVFVELLRHNLIPAETQLIYITGSAYYDQVREDLKGLPLPGVIIKPYLNDMPAALAVVDLVISRAGATTLAEITAKGVPAILIPSPNVAYNHQFFNALLLAQEGAALLLEEKDLSPWRLAEEMDKILKPGILSDMAGKSRKLGIPNAAENMYQCLLEVINEKRR